MARPGRPERNTVARSFRQLKRFHCSINLNKVFGTHAALTQACDQPELALSSQRRVASSVQPGNREPWSYTLAGTNDEMMSRFGVMQRCGVRRNTQGNQQA